MILVIGGAYSGKLDFVKNTYNIKEEDIYFCKGDTLDFSKIVISGLHKFTYECILKGINPLEIINKNIDNLKDKIIICDEISSGIVPLKKDERFWREYTGRCLQVLSRNSQKVYRVFCGIPTLIKEE